MLPGVFKLVHYMTCRFLNKAVLGRDDGDKNPQNPQNPNNMSPQSGDQVMDELGE